MFIRTTSTPNSPRKSVKIVESVREGYKVKQVMLLHVGIGANEEEIEKLKQLGREFIVQEKIRREKESKQPCPASSPTMPQKFIKRFKLTATPMLRKLCIIKIM